MEYFLIMEYRSQIQRPASEHGVPVDRLSRSLQGLGTISTYEVLGPKYTFTLGGPKQW